jgi:hypothetical protein
VLRLETTRNEELELKAALQRREFGRTYERVSVRRFRWASKDPASDPEDAPSELRDWIWLWGLAHTPRATLPVARADAGEPKNRF